MIFWIVAALITALVTTWVATPLFVTKLQQTHKRLGLILCFLIPILALGIYFFCGNPHLVE